MLPDVYRMRKTLGPRCQRSWTDRAGLRTLPDATSAGLRSLDQDLCVLGQFRGTACLSRTAVAPAVCGRDGAPGQVLDLRTQAGLWFYFTISM